MHCSIVKRLVFLSLFSTIISHCCQEYELQEFQPEQRMVLWQPGGLRLQDAQHFPVVSADPVASWDPTIVNSKVNWKYVAQVPLEPVVIWKPTRIQFHSNYHAVGNQAMQFNVQNMCEEAQDLRSLSRLRNGLWFGNTAIVRDCLDLEGVGTEANVQDGWSGLHLACQRGQFQIVEDYVTRNAQVNKPGPGGVRPIMLAVQSNSTPIVKRLLEDPELRVDATDKQKNTALIRSAAAGRREMVEALVAAGANVLKKNSAGKTALQIAQERAARWEMVELDDKSSSEDSGDDEESDDDFEMTKAQKKKEYAKVVASLMLVDEQQRKAKKEKDDLFLETGFHLVDSPKKRYEYAYNGGTKNDPPPSPSEGWGKWFKRSAKEILNSFLG